MCSLYQQTKIIIITIIKLPKWNLTKLNTHAHISKDRLNTNFLLFDIEKGHSWLNHLPSFYIIFTLKGWYGLDESAVVQCLAICRLLTVSFVRPNNLRMAFMFLPMFPIWIAEHFLTQLPSSAHHTHLYQSPSSPPLHIIYSFPLP